MPVTGLVVSKFVYTSPWWKEKAGSSGARITPRKWDARDTTDLVELAEEYDAPSPEM